MTITHGIKTMDDLNADCLIHILEYASSFPGWKYRKNNLGWCRQLNTIIYDHFEPSLVKYRNGTIEWGMFGIDMSEDEDSDYENIHISVSNYSSVKNGMHTNLSLTIYPSGHMSTYFLATNYSQRVESNFEEICPYSPDSFFDHHEMRFQDHNIGDGVPCDCNWCKHSNSIKCKRCFPKGRKRKC